MVYFPEAAFDLKLGSLSIMGIIVGNLCQWWWHCEPLLKSSPSGITGTNKVGQTRQQTPQLYAIPPVKAKLSCCFIFSLKPLAMDRTFDLRVDILFANPLKYLPTTIIKRTRSSYRQVCQCCCELLQLKVRWKPWVSAEWSNVGVKVKKVKGILPSEV